MATNSSTSAVRAVSVGLAALLIDAVPGQSATNVPAPASSPAPAAVAAPAAPANALPALPAGVEELKFHEIFAPAGARGLEYTAKAKALDGRRVRILGYMVRTCRHDHGRFLLAPIPVTLHDHEMGPADDLPPSTVFVEVPPLRRALKFVPWEPGLFLLTGTLRLGGRDELHGRRSWVRLDLERPEAEAVAATPAAASVAADADAASAPNSTRPDTAGAAATSPAPRAASVAPAAPPAPRPSLPPRPTPDVPNQR